MHQAASYPQSGSDWAIWGITIAVFVVGVLIFNWWAPRYGPPKYRKYRDIRSINWTRAQREAERERKRQEGQSGRHEA